MYPFKRTQHSYPVLSLSSSCFDRASLVAQLVKKKKKLPVTAAGFDPWVGVFPRRRERLPTPVFWPGEFPGLYSLLLLLSRFSRVRLCATPETAPPFLGFSRQERWSGSPFLQCMQVKSEREVAQSCPTLRDPMDCSLPGSSAHGIFPGKSTGAGCLCLLRCIVYGAAKSQTGLSDFHFTSIMLHKKELGVFPCFILIPISLRF